MTTFDEDLPDLLRKFLLATRCLGRATPFPHSLMQNVLASLDAKATYAAVIQDLLARKLIVKAGKEAFALTRVGFDTIAYEQVGHEVWISALGAIQKTVATTIEQKDSDSLDLLQIHAAGLANVFYSHDKKIYLSIMNLRVQCLMALGLYEEARVCLHSMQQILDQLKSGDEA